MQRVRELDDLVSVARRRVKWLLDFDVGSLLLMPPDPPRGDQGNDRALSHHIALTSGGDAKQLAEEALAAGHTVRREKDGSYGLAMTIEHGAIAFERSRPFSPEDLLIGRLLAAFFGAALDRAQHLREIRHLAKELEDASRQREHLLRMVIHDLRNPLSGLTGALELLGSTSRDLEPRSRQMLTLATAGANSLESLVESLLGVVQHERGSFEPQLVVAPVAELLADVITRHRPQASLQNVTLRLDTERAPASWTLDRNWIARTVENLLLNAIRYSPPDSEVAVAASERIDGAGRRLRIAISDEGPGIPPGERERIFEAGVRLSDEGRATRRGVGLGLAFCRLAVEHHGGWIGIVDAETSGACVVFEIPEDSDVGETASWPTAWRG